MSKSSEEKENEIKGMFAPPIGSDYLASSTVPLEDATGNYRRKMLPLSDTESDENDNEDDSFVDPLSFEEDEEDEEEN